MLELLTLALMALTAALFASQGVFLAAAMWLSVWLAGFFAFWVFEPLADWLDPLLGHFADGVALTGLFCLALVALRGARRWLVRHDIFFPLWLDRGGGAFFGLLAGYALAGLIFCIWQTLPIHQNFLNYEPQQGITIGQPDRLWLAVMHRASRQNLSRADPAEEETYVFDPDASFIWRYYRYRRIPPGGSAPRPHGEEFPFGPIPFSRPKE
ncbi:MAG: CvpA family protein [Gemmatales bacterium]|nr:CvpA family protein [Gemmatales bacterium]MDW7993430.1 CvpA family protein [Gemmatales bacterium]